MKINIEGMEYNVTPLIEWDKMFICVHNQYDSYKKPCTQEELDTKFSWCIAQCLIANGVNRPFEVVLTDRTLH
jgi:hypothetical protein